MVLDLAAGLAAAKGLAVKGSPIDDGAKESADVDVIECVILVRPCLIGVVDFELEIGRNPSWLDGRHVGANDLDRKGMHRQSHYDTHRC